LSVTSATLSGSFPSEDVFIEGERTPPKEFYQSPSSIKEKFGYPACAIAAAEEEYASPAENRPVESGLASSNRGKNRKEGEFSKQSCPKTGHFTFKNHCHQFAVCLAVSNLA